MTKRRETELQRIAQVVQVAFEADQARMRRLKLQEEELHDRLDGLTPHRDPPQPGAPIDPATLAGADLRWQRWAEERRREINLSLARLRVEQAQAAQVLARSFGRSQAVSELMSAGRARQRNGR